MRANGIGDIDYYEELGVERDATQEQIRESFRSLVRLLHPDHQQDEGLKQTAERQLRKLNRIHAVLADPERRRRYDSSLETEYRVPPTIVINPATAFRAREMLTRFVWIGAAVLGVALVIWLATDPPATPFSQQPPTTLEKTPRVEQSRPHAEVAANQAAGQSSDDEVLQLRAALRVARAERDEARRELMEMEEGRSMVSARPTRPLPALSTPAESAASSGPSTPSNSVTPPPTGEVAPPRLAPAVARPVAPATSAAAPGPLARNPKTPGSDARQFVGFWFFTKTNDPNRNKNLYYPEFIEATLTEQNGSIHGRYRSRYQILDRAISPDVNFEFSGAPSNGTITCSWSGPGGARGQLTLRMTGENAMKVDWTASELGSLQGLASGTATLTRRID
jgi:curved DNA-binding protein CbpA